MALQSMTGFARSQGSFGETGWIWELRAVNGKALDVRFRLPSGMEAIEAPLREALSARILRGNIQVSLQMEEGGASVLPVLNEEALSAAEKIVARVSEKTGMQPASMDALLAIRGVVEYRETTADPAKADARREALLKSFAEAVAALEKARLQEGAATLDDVRDRAASQLDEFTFDHAAVST